eukprot:m.288416 g.288416  ORF g.288416 m.288416 type:complete len:946 (+) comp11961_c0_seq1:182-3019(+)
MSSAMLAARLALRTAPRVRTRTMVTHLARPVARRPALGIGPGLRFASPPQRAFSVGLVVRLVTSRLIWVPTILVGSASAMIVELKSHFPDVPDFGIADTVSTFSRTLQALSERMLRIATQPSTAKSATATAVTANAVEATPAISEDAAKAAAADGASSDEAMVELSEAAYEAMMAELEQLREIVGHTDEMIEAARERSVSEMLEERAKYEKEIDRLKEEVEDLHRHILLEDIKGNSRDRPRRAIDVFSEILDLRAKADTTFNAHDRLPRVVVVGDQSAGKTSVLEVIVRARIFPRGVGEMMTRSPIQVTLSEGKEHTARLKNSDLVYNLDDEEDLVRLRNHIESEMNKKLRDGNVVSPETVALEVRGPGLHPMVLVDLPGIINHHTQGMPGTTKDSIIGMCQRHIENPNSIVLCIQDASRDAEGSSVADLVSRADPEGDRTIFVLTKVDLAEQLQLPAQKLKAILKGKRFNMKARAYFAVVTGTKNAKDSIDTIRKSEKSFFDQSALYREGVFASKNMGTDNLSRAVSELFWHQVRETVMQESKDVSSKLKQKETEWKFSFPNEPRRSRNDLFMMGRQHVIEALSHFDAAMTAAQWEEKLTDEIWQQIRGFVIDSLYINSADLEDPPSFRTNVENMLDAWVGSELPDLSVSVASRTLLDEFMAAIDFDDSDGIYDKLKQTVRSSVVSSSKWDPRVTAKVKGVQELMLRDDVIKDNTAWNSTVAFMLKRLQEEYVRNMTEIEELKGPSPMWQWLTWKSPTPDQREHAAVFEELQSYFSQKELSKSWLDEPEVQAACQNIKRRFKMDVDPDFVQNNYRLLYRAHFLDNALSSAAYCQSRFGLAARDNKPCNKLQCADVYLFWRLHNMLDATGKILRIEATEYKKDIEDEVRDVLDRLSVDDDAKIELLTGRRVALAEEIEILRHIQSKLDSFVKMLRKEGEDGRYSS